MKISFCLITLNEEENLGRCLESCASLADEIIVVDSGSSDATPKIASDFHARFVHQDWLGYVGQKNLALSLAAHEWVFSIDADEQLSKKLQGELQKLKATMPDSGIGGFDMPRCVFYENRWIRHGDWYPDRLVRLFRRECAKFAGGRVHERLEVRGRVLGLAGDLYHYSFRDAPDHRARSLAYSELWARDKFENGRRPMACTPMAHAVFRWLRGYILRRGFLDGAQGWRIAAICAQETYFKYKLLRKMSNGGVTH
jgi:glycosyltransferase involved in cell wall biosynthesis